MYRLLTYLVITQNKFDFCLIFLLFVTASFSTPLYAFTEEELQWFANDEEKNVDSVNEGELNFLTTTKNNTLHSINVLTINTQSIDTGWVKLRQCYRHLDKLPAVDITYQYRFMRALAIHSKKQIEKATINNQTISLENISDNAEICVRAEVRIFYQNSDGTFSLMNGPYHRRFLDGYYPYHVTLAVTYPQHVLRPVKTIPEEQQGFEIIHQQGKTTIDTVFEGILNTEIIFKLIDNK